MKNKKLSGQIEKISESILETVVDLLLWEIVYLGEASMTFSRNTWEPKNKADKFLEEINYQTLKKALARARQKGWLRKTSVKERGAWPEITAAGKKRLNLLIPQYDGKRVWDKRLYLVTYDVLETRKKDRELLREYLKRIGAALIQDSVWLTPYNPRVILREFVRERNLTGAIIVSDLGQDGSIGDENLKDLIVRVYKLQKINNQYADFLEEFENQKERSSKVSFVYFGILKDDPQLPFELLPQGWLGEKAHQLFQERGLN